MHLWGVIVTRTCHLVTPGPGLDPVCRNGAVMETMAGLRRRHATGDREAPRIFGLAGGRPACRDCIRGLDRLAARARQVVNEARTHNELMEANDGNT